MVTVHTTFHQIIIPFTGPCGDAPFNSCIVQKMSKTQKDIPNGASKINCLSHHHLSQNLHPHSLIASSVIKLFEGGGNNNNIDIVQKTSEEEEEEEVKLCITSYENITYKSI
jgi:hypothetical protein